MHTFKEKSDMDARLDITLSPHKPKSINSFLKADLRVLEESAENVKPWNT